METAHARHVVAVSTRRMRGNKIDFYPVEDELRERRRLKIAHLASTGTNIVSCIIDRVIPVASRQSCLIKGNKDGAVRAIKMLENAGLGPVKDTQ